MPENNQPKPAQKLSPEKYARLRAEAAAPYRGLRKFIYGTFAASGFIGAVVFLAQLAAGRDVATALPNFALQVGVVAAMIWLFRIDRPKSTISSKKGAGDAASMPKNNKTP